MLVSCEGILLCLFRLPMYSRQITQFASVVAHQTFTFAYNHLKKPYIPSILFMNYFIYYRYVFAIICNSTNQFSFSCCFSMF